MRIFRKTSHIQKKNKSAQGLNTEHAPIDLKSMNVNTK